MDAEKSILVEKTPTVSRRKITKTNAFVDGKRLSQTTSHSTAKRVTITTNDTESLKQRQATISPNDILPAPDYPDEAPTIQTSQKGVNVIKIICEIMNIK